MPNAELLAFFRKNTSDTPHTAERWFKLPNKALIAAQQINPDELVSRFLAGESPSDILNLSRPTPTKEAGEFIDEFVPVIQGFLDRREGEDAIKYASKSLSLVAKKFSADQLIIVKQKVLAARGSAQGHLVEKGALRSLPFGDKLRSYCVLSAATDYMRADLESGQITDRGRTIAECFGYAGMSVLQQKAVEKYFGQRLEILYHDSLRPIPKFSTPKDPEIRRLQREILGRLIPG